MRPSQMRHRGEIGLRLVIQMVDSKQLGVLLCLHGSLLKKTIFMFLVFMVLYSVSCSQQLLVHGGTDQFNILEIQF